MTEVIEQLEAPHVTWYGRGDTQVVALPSPGTGNILTRTLDGAVEWCIHAVAVELTAAGGGGAREPFLTLVDGTGVAFFGAGQQFTVASGNTSLLVWANDVQPFGANNSAIMGTSIPNLRLYSGLEIIVNASNLGAADTLFNGRLFVTQYPIRP